MIEIIVIIVFAILIFYLFYYCYHSSSVTYTASSYEDKSFKRAKEIGDKLEVKQKRMISDFFPDISGFYDMYIPYNNSFTQIDAILVTHHGLIVIECKNYTGRIYGGVHKDYWTQYLGEKSFKIINPIAQNNNHIKALKHFLNINVPCYSIINYGNADFRKVNWVNSGATLVNNNNIIKAISDILSEYSRIEVNTDPIINKLQAIKHYNKDTKVLEMHKQYVAQCKEYYERNVF